MTILPQTAALKNIWENSQNNIHCVSLKLSPVRHVFKLIFHKFIELLLLTTHANDCS